MDIISVMPGFVRDGDENVQINVAKIKNSFIANDKLINDYATQKHEAGGSGKKQKRGLKQDIERMHVGLKPAILLTSQECNDPQSAEKKSSLKYIPSHHPSFPFAHTYNATPVNIFDYLCLCVYLFSVCVIMALYIVLFSVRSL